MAITFKWISKKGISGGVTITNIKDGVTYIDNFSEELDSATVVLTRQTQNYDFEPFDVVELTLPTIGTKTMLINDFVKTQMSLGNNLYEYTINLMSKTKELERVTLPNISITKPKGGTAKTLQTVMEQIVNDYSPVYINGAGVIEKIYEVYDSGILNNYCPDLQISRPTLRAALDRILSVNNSICYLDGNNIKYLNLNERGNEISFNKYYNYFPENQSANDYASESENNYNNVVPNEIENIKSETNVTSIVGFRTDQMIVDDENACLLTQNPIYDLKKVEFCGTLKFDENGQAGACTLVLQYDGNSYTISLPIKGTLYYEIDITDFIVESQEYNIMSYSDQLYHAYYTRGNNKIEGLLKNNKLLFLNSLTLDNIIVHKINSSPSFLIAGDIKAAFESQIGSSINPSRIDNIYINTIVTKNNLTINYDNGYRASSMFNITYEAQNENIRMRSGKYLPETNQNNIIVDNPGEVYIDIKRQGELFNQKCNRLGNRVRYIQARVPINYLSYSPLPELSDYFEDYVLIRRELQFYDDYVVFKGTLTENYVNINYFTGINARKRTWNLVSAGEAFDKELLDKWYCEFSFNSKPIYESSLYIGGWFWNRLLNVFNYEEPGNNHQYVNRCLLYNNNTFYSYGGINWNYIELDLTTYISGNSLIFNAKVNDNYSAGIFVTDKGSLGGGDIEKYAKYTDPNGFADEFKIYLFNQNYNGIIDHWGYTLYNGQTIVSGVEDSGVTYDIYKLNSQLRPKIFLNLNQTPSPIETMCLYAVNFENHKDSRETLGFNIQFEFCSDTPDIIVGEAFMERQQLINTGSNEDLLKYYGSEEIYKITEKKYKGDGFTLYGRMTTGPNDDNRSGYINFTVSDNILNQPNTHEFNSVAICDQNDRLIMAINTSSSSFNIYLNMLKTRDRNKYLSRDLKTWL